MNKHASKHYIKEFEEEFEIYMNNISAVFFNSGKKAARPAVQALVDSYYLEKGELNPLIPNFNTLLMLIEITNASYESSGENQSLKILEAAKPLISLRVKG
ncbi:hypothetical protein I6E72_05190 [Pseudoalteromonas sp. NSLLW24]|uniref:hypothetical protein n=1 Tax=Pseudoalteromonas sp. NSLLW24 TaxID=2792050 RepID=UPI0018CF8E34|nr:hypothetical protein [Pseudoalteromonas sp. NSLLW24]MBG9998353.1 hypothetical protein [Pseudoalteromonas sp. NSLLW24]